MARRVVLSVDRAVEEAPKRWSGNPSTVPAAAAVAGWWRVVSRFLERYIGWEEVDGLSEGPRRSERGRM